VLVVGIYLAGKPNHAEHIVTELAGTTRYQLTQRWVSLGVEPLSPVLSQVTRRVLGEAALKIVLLNELLAWESLQEYEYIILFDDDVRLPEQFLDRFLGLQTKFGFCLAQPARTGNSSIDHPIVAQRAGLVARETLFVEIGPIVSVHRSAYEFLFPLDATSPMGWGLENVWAYEVSRRGLKMGIIDACPVEHSLRRTAEHYDRVEADLGRIRLLEGRAHIPLEECCQILDVIAVPTRPAGVPTVGVTGTERQSDPVLPFGVNVSGYLASEKGVGEGVRSNLRILQAARIPFAQDHFVDPGSLNLDTTFTNFATGKIYRFNLVHVGAKHSPDFVRERGPAYFQGRYNIGYWAWELSSFPHRWVPSFRFFDEIWVPSTFALDAVSRVAPIPVVKVPHCVDVPRGDVDPRLGRCHFGLPEEPFIFLFVFDFSSRVERKNPEAIIEAFRTAFGPNDEALLILKSSHSALHPRELERLLRAARGASVQIIDGVVTRDEIDALIGFADCYVSLHRSEGFGLTLAEAMARGKPVIATNYSGNIDFMSPDNSFLVDYDLVEIPEKCGEYDQGNVWAAPNTQHAAELMRFVFENRDEAHQVGQAARRTVLRDLSACRLGRIVSDRLRSISERDDQGHPATVNTSRTGDCRLGRAGRSPRCSVIIPVLNKAALTRQCLDTLLSLQAGAHLFEIIVVDDGSNDSTPQLLAGYGDQVHHLKHGANLGFARACNHGAEVAIGSDLVFLNNDTIPKEGWLDALVHHADTHPRAAVVGSKLLFPNETIQHAGVVICQDRRPRHIYTGFPSDHPAVNRNRRFQVVTGACILVRCGPFEQAGGFDTAFVNSFEDVDLCLRLGELGYEVHYCHQSELYHLESVTRAGRVEEELRNFEIYFSRWAERIEPDDLRYFIEDGLIDVRYLPLYPIQIAISPELAVVESRDLGQRTTVTADSPSHEVHRLLKETIRLKVRLKEMESLSGFVT